MARTESLLAVLALLVIFAAPLHAAAQTDERAATGLARGRELYTEGLEAFEAGRLEDALAAFRGAYDASRVPAALFNVATTLRQMERYAEALDAARALLRDHPDETTLRDSVIELVGNLRAIVAVAVLTDLPAGVTLTVDGASRAITDERPFELALDPGAHALRIELVDHAPFEWRGEIGRGERREIAVQLTPLSHDDGARAEGPQFFWSWLALATTALSTGVTIGLGVQTESTYQGLRAGCGASAGCSDAEISGLTSWATATNAMIGVSAALAAATVVVFVLEGTAQRETRVAFTPYGLVLSGEL